MVGCSDDKCWSSILEVNVKVRYLNLKEVGSHSAASIWLETNYKMLSTGIWEWWSERLVLGELKLNVESCKGEELKVLWNCEWEESKYTLCKKLDPILMSGCKGLVFVGPDRWKIRAIKKDDLFSIVRIRRPDRVRSEDGRKLCGVKTLLERHLDENMLKWHGPIGCMADDILVKVYGGTI